MSTKREFYKKWAERLLKLSPDDPYLEAHIQQLTSDKEQIASLVMIFNNYLRANCNVLTAGSSNWYGSKVTTHFIDRNNLTKSLHALAQLKFLPDGRLLTIAIINSSSNLLQIYGVEWLYNLSTRSTPAVQNAILGELLKCGFEGVLWDHAHKYTYPEIMIWFEKTSSSYENTNSVIQECAKNWAYMNINWENFFFTLVQNKNHLITHIIHAAHHEGLTTQGQQFLESLHSYGNNKAIAQQLMAQADQSLYSLAETVLQSHSSRFSHDLINIIFEYISYTNLSLSAKPFEVLHVLFMQHYSPTDILTNYNNEVEIAKAMSQTFVALDKQYTPPTTMIKGAIYWLSTDRTKEQKWDLFKKTAGQTLFGSSNASVNQVTQYLGGIVINTEIQQWQNSARDSLNTRIPQWQPEEKHDDVKADEIYHLLTVLRQSINQLNINKSTPPILTSLTTIKQHLEQAIAEVQNVERAKEKERSKHNLIVGLKKIKRNLVVIINKLQPVSIPEHAAGQKMSYC